MIRDRRVALAYIGALVVFFLIIGHVFYLFDRKIRKPQAL
jgi:hypothetical protein